jgi:PAS domain S-box-containing protein
MVFTFNHKRFRVHIKDERTSAAHLNICGELMKQSLEKRIILFSFIILSMTSLANTAMDIAVFRKEYVQEMLLRSHSLGTALKGSIEKVLALGIDIQDVNGLSEKCREIIQSDPEMAYCVITTTGGKSLFASEPVFSSLDFSHPRTQIASNIKGRDWAAFISTPKDTFFDIQTPINTFDTTASAIIHIGFPKKVIDQKVYAVIQRAVIVFLVFLFISFALVILFVKRSIVSPITSLLGGVTRISKGDFSTPVQALPIHELDQLGININSMALALETRDRQLQKNYAELSDTHSQLNDSFLSLEKVSLELEKSEQLYKKLQEEAGDAIIILDDSETVLIVNRMAEEFLDIAAPRIIGQHISNMLLQIRADNIPHLLTQLKNAYESSGISDEVLFTNRKSDRLTGKMHASHIVVDDKALLQIIIRDITREKEILANLENSAAGLARLNRMKDSFLGMVSHELKTPLTVVMGYSELLLTEMDDQLPDTTREMIKNISTASSRLDCIVKDMIDVTMIDKNILGLKLAPVDINALIESTIREMHGFLSIRRQKITTALEASLPLLRGDQSRLTQLLTNIIGNAIKFTPDGGAISVTTALKDVVNGQHQARIEAGSELESSSKLQQVIEIVITDNGIGINPEEQVRIFDKFYEVGNIEEHSSGKVAFKSKGAGLGLSICKGVVEVHGGRIWVESQAYDPVSCPGSSFIIHLPLDLIQSDGTVMY